MQIPYTTVLYRNRAPFIVVLHALFAGAALTLAFLLRFDFTLGGPAHEPLLYRSLPINIVIFLICSAVFNLFQGIWRYVSVDDLKDIVKTSAVASLVFLLVIVLGGSAFKGYPRSAYLMNFALFILLTGGTCFAIRIFRESFAPMAENARNVLIVGAGTAGNEIAKTLKSSKNKQYIPIGFIDRDKSMHNKRLQGLKVLGDLTTIRQHIKRHRIHEVFIAIPEATNKVVKEIMDAAKMPEWEVKFKIAPSVLDIMSGRFQVNQIRDVSIDDLLSRPNITLNDEHIRKQLAGKTVLITGAGGSIGSEICYQIAAYQPARMVLVDASELGAYEIDQSLKKRHPTIAIHTVVGSILDHGVMEMALKQLKPDYVYHAAAYKHVHLMEWNPIACYKNNVLGTAALAAMSERYGVKQFVMISTDKAVNPKGLMGVSKRLAERVILERHKSATKFNVVRFGNVLGSSGSVIPLFQKQIREGGPVTVTCEEMRRFFMSIPEAVQLVLQASVMGKGAETFVLDMGEPIRIVDLARNMIRLAGLIPDQDIKIQITGLRPGEKLYEEVITNGEHIRPTHHEKIRIFAGPTVAHSEIETWIANLELSLSEGDPAVVLDRLVSLVPEYQVSGYWQHASTPAKPAGKTQVAP